MSDSCNGSGISGNTSGRNLGGIREVEAMLVGVDLVSAARRNIEFLRIVADTRWLHEKARVVEAIRRYNELWMPLVSDLTVVGSTPPLVLPPLDVEWVWFCHTLNPVSYRQYCELKFSKLIGKPAIFNEGNEEYALMRCKEIWSRKYPSEPFENETDLDVRIPAVTDEELLAEVTKHRFLYSKFSEAYRSEIVYLIAARHRYKGFLHMVQRFSDECSRFVPASDILLMWLTHQSYPTLYAEDLKEMEGDMGKVVTVWESVKEKEVKETKMLWETAFDQPYEKAGGEIALKSEITASVKSPVHWEVSDTDVNTKYKSMLPRFLLEVCLFVKLNLATQQNVKWEFLRLRMLRGHKELKLDKSISNFHYDSWQKSWNLCCEFGTEGVVLEIFRQGGHCFKGSSLQGTVTFHWNELLRAPSQTLEREVSQQVRIVASITPPVQAPYLLKCVPDRVTDDSGAMISDLILRMNRYRPQEGRWLSKTVLDHARRECFVVRMRVGGGFWRRGGETPSPVKWEDRIIEIREGSWSYVAGSIGRAPEKVIATATPKEPPEQWKAAWNFSTGDELMIGWESSTSISSLCFYLGNQASPESSVKLLKGRKMHYQVKNIKSESKDEEIQNQNEEDEDGEEDEEEEGFVTIVRFTEENPTGRATALLNWKLLVAELLAEEDAALALLLCLSILISVSKMKKEDLGCLLTRRRLKEAKLGARDWGSVTLHPSSYSSSISSPHLQPWYWNAKAVLMGTDGADLITRQPALNYSPVEGSDDLYKRGILK
ncbi:hypothetical protein I3843_07G023700 [Carya illinoinensis]|nr:hypothetical protein I3843_07G023700 [Carya illinoinensis]